MAGEGLTFVTDPPLTEDLVARMTEIWIDVTNAGGSVGGVAPADAEQLQPVIEDALGRVEARKDHMVLATLDDQMVGFGFLAFRPGPLFRHWATVKRLQVDPKLQGRGYGGAILDELTRVARDDLGLEALHLTVRGGTGTEGFYERHGYKELARIPDAIRLAPDDTREEIYMVARL
ncbi:MAG TPA: GNAT family N-acetyltransferase [Actinomycetota bacterium]|nr:GNAT family N-acetyltransferase [Actinomycetota bacterium]